MNLLQIQDQLKSLPSDPSTMQSLMAYANGSNPAVPPYLALGELNRRKQLMEKAQMDAASQPPQGSVKDQVAQQAGIMALQQGRQQQTMQNLMRMGGAGPQVTPAGIPQPEAQPQAQMAGGGLLDLMRGKSKRMNSGGIVALAAGGTGEDDEEDDDTEEPSGGVTSREAFDEMMRSRRQADAFVKAMQAQKTPETFLDRRDRLVKERPEEFGVLTQDKDPEVLSRFDELQTARRAELEKQREEAKAQKPGILQLLGQAAMDSRGQQGRSALASILGGYSKLQSGADAKSLEQEQALRAKDLDMQQAKMEVINKLQDLKRARAEGDFEKQRKSEMDIANILKTNNTTLGNLLGKGMTSSGALAGRLGAAETAAAAKIRASASAAQRAAKDTDQTRGIEILKADIREKNPEMSETQVAAEALRQYRLGTPSGVGVTQRTTADAEKALSQFKLINRKQWKAYVESMGGDEAAASKAYVDGYRSNVLPPQLMPQTPGASAKPAAAAPSTTPTQAVPLPKNATKESLKVGTVYQTARGLGKWNGTAFESVE